MGVEFDSILEPGDVWTRNALSHAVEGQFATQNVLGFEVRSVHHTSALSSQANKLFSKSFPYRMVSKRHKAMEEKNTALFRPVMGFNPHSIFIQYSDDFASIKSSYLIKHRNTRKSRSSLEALVTPNMEYIVECTY